MPVLKDYRTTVKLTLPVTKGNVWIYDCILAKDSLEIDKIYVTETEVAVEPGQKQMKPISIRAAKYYEAMETQFGVMIAKWDFTDEQGKEISPTIENIKRLPKQDFDYLNVEIEKRINVKLLNKEQKKNK